jgi:excisionase family DNA binding protein
MFSTREAAKRLKLQARTLSRYIQSGKIPAPKMFTSGKMTVHLWTEEEIERANLSGGRCHGRGREFESRRPRQLVQQLTKISGRQSHNITQQSRVTDFPGLHDQAGPGDYARRAVSKFDTEPKYLLGTKKLTISGMRKRRRARFHTLPVQ